MFLLIFTMTIVSVYTDNITQYRGTVINPNSTLDDFRVLATWNPNLIRWQLSWGLFPHGPADKADVAEYKAWLQTALRDFDAALPIFRESRIKVLLDLHTPPGGRDPHDKWPLFYNQTFQDAYLSVWEMMANRYKNETQIMGYDILNEPNDKDVIPGLLNWRDLAIAVIQRIRAIDPQRTIFVEGSPGGDQHAILKLGLLPFDNMIYSFHYYTPYRFTFQNLYFNITPQTYPGVVAGVMWDKERIRTELQGVAQWKKANNITVHVGEFSAVRWTPGNSTFYCLSDCIDLFEEFGWYWDYHCFRETQAFDVEMIGDKDHPHRSPTPTLTQALLMDWFKKNQH